MTDEKPTNEELDAIYGAVLLRPDAESDEHCPALRAVFEAGVASQAARIAELERLVKDTHDTLDEYEETINRKFMGEQAELMRLRTERDTLARELAEERERLRLAELKAEQRGEVVRKQEAELSRLRANSYAAAAKALRAFSQTEAGEFGEVGPVSILWVADWLESRLSQQSAPQAAQGGDNEERALVDCLDARAFHESIATDLEDYARIVETDRLEGADIVEGLREQARQLRKCDRLSRAHDQLATVTRERDEQARGVDHQERLADMFERERDDALDKVDSQAARIAELEGELATTTTVLGEAYAANEALKSERDTLTRRVAELERETVRLIERRDEFHDAADELAYAIADESIIGEHTSANNPWKRALEALENERAESEQSLKKAQSKAEHYERDWYDAKSEFGDAMARLRAERDTLTRELAEERERSDQRQKARLLAEMTLRDRERELAEARAYGDERNNECNKLQRYLNLAAEERDSARSELAEAKEELVCFDGGVTGLLFEAGAPRYALDQQGKPDPKQELVCAVPAKRIEQLRLLLDAHRAKASTERVAGR